MGWVSWCKSDGGVKVKRWVKRFGWVSDERPCCMKFNSLDVEARSDDPGPPPPPPFKKKKRKEKLSRSFGRLRALTARVGSVVSS